MPKVYADDAGFLTKNSTETALHSVRNLDLNGEQLDVVCKLKSLGTQLRCPRRMTNDVAEGLVRKGINTPDAFVGHSCRFKRKPA